MIPPTTAPAIAPVDIRVEEDVLTAGVAGIEFEDCWDDVVIEYAQKAITNDE